MADDPEKVPTVPERKDGQNDPEFANQSGGAPAEDKPNEKSDVVSDER